MSLLLENLIDTGGFRWQRYRPFFDRLAPEWVWPEFREVLREEIEAEFFPDSPPQGFRNRYVWPTPEHFRAVVSMAYKGSYGVALVGAVAAHGLATLAGAIRLEHDPAYRNLFQAAFDRLWLEFGQYDYFRGYDTTEVRSSIVNTLIAGRVMNLALTDQWLKEIRAYFDYGRDAWSQQPLAQSLPQYPVWLRDLYIQQSEADHPLLRGVFDLSEIPLEDWQNHYQVALHSWIPLGYEGDNRWEHPHYNQPRALTSPRRRPRPLPTFLADWPWAYLRFEHPEPDQLIATEGTSRLPGHLLRLAVLRHQVLDTSPRDEWQALGEIAAQSGLPQGEAELVIGHLIRLGLADFDRAKGSPWYHQGQRYRINNEAVAGPPRDYPALEVPENQAGPGSVIMHAPMAPRRKPLVLHLEDLRVNAQIQEFLDPPVPQATPHRHLGIYGVVVQNEYVLVVRKTRGAYAGSYDLPGGSPEHGESPETTLRREVQEETGLAVMDMELLGLRSVRTVWQRPDQVFEDLHHFGAIYRVELFPEQPVSMAGDREDSGGALWLPVKMVPLMPRSLLLHVCLVEGWLE